MLKKMIKQHFTEENQTGFLICFGVSIVVLGKGGSLDWLND